MTGVRISLIVGFGVTAISMVVGLAAGAIAGYRRGWVDSLISAIVEFTWGFPLILLAVVLAGTMGPGLTRHDPGGRSDQLGGIRPHRARGSALDCGRRSSSSPRVPVAWRNGESSCVTSCPTCWRRRW